MQLLLLPLQLPLVYSSISHLYRLCKMIVTTTIIIIISGGCIQLVWKITFPKQRHSSLRWQNICMQQERNGIQINTNFTLLFFSRSVESFIFFVFFLDEMMKKLTKSKNNIDDGFQKRFVLNLHRGWCAKRLIYTKFHWIARLPHNSSHTTIFIISYQMAVVFFNDYGME